VGYVLRKRDRTVNCIQMQLRFQEWNRMKSKLVE
jgi:hypothetical protein